MGKVSEDDKMRIQTLREQGLGYRVIASKYPTKNWKLDTVKAICRRFDERGSALLRKPGSGRPKTARTIENIERVQELICSQEEPGTSKSTRQIANDIKISAASVKRIAKKDLGLHAFRRVPAQVISDAVKEKRLTRCKRLLRRITPKVVKKVFFTDEKIFYTNPPINNQNNRVWSTGRKADVDQNRLLVERAKFSPHVMVSAGVCHSGKGRLHFIADKAKVNAKYYVEELLPMLVEDCENLMPQDFIFQQDGAPAHGAKLSQDWISVNCPDFIEKDSWPPNSPDLNPLDYHVWGAMLEKFNKLNPKPKNIEELKRALQEIWDDLPQAAIIKAILGFRKRLQACVTASGGHFEHHL
jgi:transposase